MKKLLLLASGISLCLGPLTAAIVPVQTAQTVAVNFYKGNISPAAVATLKYTRTETDGIADFYVFDIAPHGFVIVAADDVVQPVIGYSDESLFKLGFDHTAVKTWMDHAAKNIHSGILSGVSADARISALWTAYKLGPYGHPSRSAVGPLLSTTWDQSPYYNDLCPYYAPDQQRAVTGCVATAMAQIMKFWNYPAQGVGSYSYVDSISHGFSANYGVQSANFGATTYGWTSMPASINSANTPIATLMYHCGVSVAMDYGDDNQGGSGAWVIQQEAGGDTMPCAEYAFRHYFAYDTVTLLGVDESQYSSDQWIALLKADLDAGRPIQYEGDDIGGGGGHSWVCDGYDANDMVHMNWGWSGASDGYFAVNSLTAGGYNFSADEGALMGIQPPPPFRVTAQAASPMICHGTSTKLTAYGPASATYTWAPTTGLSCPTCDTTTASPTATTVYTAIGDSAGVQVRYSVLITVAPGITAAFDAPIASACTAPASVQFTNNSQYASTYVWDFGDGSALSTDTSPAHIYNAYNTYTVKLYATGSCGLDSMVRTQYVTVTDITPSATGSSVCNGTSVALSASTSGHTVNWYTTDSGGMALYSGLTYQTPPVTATTTYYMEAANPGAQQYVGPSSDAFGTGGNFGSNNGHSLIFDCHKPQTLVSVDVFAQGAGVRTIYLFDSYFDTLSALNVNIPDGASTVTLNFPLPVGTGLSLNASGNINLYRNQSGATYPYYSADSSVVITGSDVQGAYYYFFYNWQLQAPSCTSARVPVTVSVMNGAATFTAQQTGLVVAFAPTVTSGVTYQWSFGDGSAVSTDQSPTHTYTTSGNYTVQLIESNGSCTDTLTQLIGAYPTGITELTALDHVSIYPVPAHDEIGVKVGASQSTSAQLIITDMVGKVISQRDVQLTGGSNTLTENIAAYASGVYVLTLQSGAAKVTSRFVKE